MASWNWTWRVSYIYIKLLAPFSTENGADYQTTLKEITGLSSVPQVFFRGQFIGE